MLGNGLFGRYDPSTGAHRYYLKDNLGSTRAVVDNSGNIQETYDYYPFGLLMPDRNGGTSSTMEKFTGKELDSEASLNLYYFGARYYDPAIGQWTSVDPLMKKYPEWSPYNYTLDNPLILVDPYGKALNWPPYGYPISFPEFNVAMNRSIRDISFNIDQRIKMGEKTTVETGAKLFDKLDNNSTLTGKIGLGIAGLGAILTPTLGPEVGLPVADFGLELSGFSISTGTVADFSSTAFKGIDAYVF